MIVNRLNKLMTNAVCKKVDELLKIMATGTTLLPPTLPESLREFLEFAAAVAESCDCLRKSCDFCIANSHIGHLIHTQYKAIFDSISRDTAPENKPIIAALECIVAYLERYRPKYQLPEYSL